MVTSLGRGIILCGESSMQEGENTVLVENPKGKKQCGRLRYRWEHHIKIDVEEMGLESGPDSFGSE